MRFHKNFIIILLTCLLIISIASNIFTYRYMKDNYLPKFKLISPNIAWMDTEDFLKTQKYYSLEYQNLKEDLIKIVNNKNIIGEYGIYFEELNTGTWIGINEKEEFVPASLLKLPVMIATLKKIQDGELTLEQKVSLRKEDIDLRSGYLGLKGEGYTLTVKELLIYLIKESDNTATYTLSNRILTTEEFDKARLAVGLNINTSHYGATSPKQYSNILRSLYYSTYLRRTFSELGLSLMSETDYNTQIPAGVPNTIPISHKIGFFFTSDGKAGYHDCGIIYYPNNNYILCVMSKNTTKQEADRVIKDISSTVYNYIDTK